MIFQDFLNLWDFRDFLGFLRFRGFFRIFGNFLKVFLDLFQNFFPVVLTQADICYDSWFPRFVTYYGGIGDSRRSDAYLIWSNDLREIPAEGPSFFFNQKKIFLQQVFFIRNEAKTEVRMQLVFIVVQIL